MSMSVKEIVIEHLEELGLKALHDWDECCCIAPNIMTCEDGFEKCTPLSKKEAAMHVDEIVTTYMIFYGYTGLYYNGDEGKPCGCSLDDFISCDLLSPYCCAGYKVQPRIEDEPSYYIIGPGDDESQENNV